MVHKIARVALSASLFFSLLGAAPNVSDPVTVTSILDNEITAGAGYSDVSPHQIIRTSGNVLYVATPSCTSYPSCPDNYMDMEKGNTTGKPSSFAIQDAAHHPASVSTSDMIGSSAMALDENGIIWVAYNTKLEGTHVKSFDTSTNTWGTDYRIGTALAANNAAYVSQGREGVAIAVNSAGTPTIVFSYDGGSTTVKYLGISTYSSGAWSVPVRIDDQTLGSNQGALHPAIAYTAGGTLLVAWLMGDENTATYNNNDGIIFVRQITDTTPSSNSEAGPASIEIPDTGNEGGHAGFAATVIDNGPSIMLTADGVAHLTYIDSLEDNIRYWYSTANTFGAASNWHGDEQPKTAGNPQETHDPSLGPDGNGGIYIYGHGTPASTRDGHGENLYRFHKAVGATTWSTWTEIVADDNIDCSVSTRWSQFYNYFPTTVDFLYWYDLYNNSTYNDNNVNYVSVN